MLGTVFTTRPARVYLRARLPSGTVAGGRCAFPCSCREIRTSPPATLKSRSGQRNDVEGTPQVRLVAQIRARPSQGTFHVHYLDRQGRLTARRVLFFDPLVVRVAAIREPGHHVGPFGFKLRGCDSRVAKPDPASWKRCRSPPRSDVARAKNSTDRAADRAVCVREDSRRRQECRRISGGASRPWISPCVAAGCGGKLLAIPSSSVAPSCVSLGGPVGQRACPSFVPNRQFCRNGLLSLR